MTVPPEINVPKGGVAIVGRDPGWHEERHGRPFVEQAPAGSVLATCMREAGLYRSEVNVLNVVDEKPPGNEFRAHPRRRVVEAVEVLQQRLSALSPRLVVALGNEAAFACLDGEWPSNDGTIWTATGIEERRGYVFDGPWGPVLPSIHPAAVARSWVPWKTLLTYDLQRAVEVRDGHLRRPKREVEVVSSDRGARSALASLQRHRRLSCDIETRGGGELACVGFAGKGGKAYVFPESYLSTARKLLESPDIGTVWANGIYDLFVLRHRYGVDVRGPIEDVQIAFHAAYAELAGRREDKKRRFTRKSLAFLASLATFDHFWKGDYETEYEFFVYNGKDCLITWDVWEWVQGHLDMTRSRAVYEHERSLILPCVDMLARGLRVDDPLRLKRIEDLQGRYDELYASLNEATLPMLERERERIADIHLFEQREGVCACCRHASKKQARCWSCAGFEKAPSKKELVEMAWKSPKFEGYASRPTIAANFKKEELEEELLRTCAVCGGAPRREWLEFNPNSDAQAKIVLYDVLKLPKKTKDGKLTTDENALKALAGGLGG